MRAARYTASPRVAVETAWRRAISSVPVWSNVLHLEANKTTAADLGRDLIPSAVASRLGARRALPAASDLRVAPTGPADPKKVTAPRQAMLFSVEAAATSEAFDVFLLVVRGVPLGDGVKG